MKLVPLRRCFCFPWLRHGIDQKYREVSTWSSLATAFNTKRSSRLGLRILKNKVGLFGIPELLDHTGFYSLNQKAQNEVDYLVKEAVSPNRQRKIVQVFDQLSDALCRVADMSDFVRTTHPEESYRYAAEEACVSLSRLVEKLNTNTELYTSLKSVIENGDKVPTDDVDNRVTKLFLFDFEQSGIHLEESKEEFVTLKENILLLGHYFQHGSQKPCSVHKSKLPENLRSVFSQEGENITVTGLFSEHFNSVCLCVREAAYRIYLYPDPHQIELLDALLLARHQMAQLVGYPTYAHRELKGTMLENPDNARLFLDKLSEAIRESADRDYAEILAAKSLEGRASEGLKPWDQPYYSAQIRQHRYSIDVQEVIPYLSLGCCMEGLNNIFRSLFGVSLQPVETEPGELWSFDVHKLAVVHEKEGVLGYIYCDFFERAGKPNQDCHFTIQGGREREDGSYQLPLVVLMLNFPTPQSSVPSLLTPGMLHNLFHEFGHAMHSMLGRTKYQHVTGTRCSTDFAEVPSVLMEYFASDPRVVLSFARHYKTGDMIPKDLVDNLFNSRKLFAASDTQLQVFYAVLDQVYHKDYPGSGKTSTELMEEVQRQYYRIPYIPDTAWHLRFGHLVGYGAKYYAYLLSGAVAASIWQKCFKQDPFNREMGEQYRIKMLSHGGGKHPTLLVQDMLGEAPTIEKLIQSLTVN
ncbi:mitochondrial intermediate peptidase-like [Liolophura sinensis]|uniref:mitochondrial intermediate peptidase-like n=1 Tax=Liolophura sinensis TaxID=3198878 RepID=UPI003158FDE7